jgi:hypothetical protein
MKKEKDILLYIDDLKAVIGETITNNFDANTKL